VHLYNEKFVKSAKSIMDKLCAAKKLTPRRLRSRGRTTHAWGYGRCDEVRLPQVDRWTVEGRVSSCLQTRKRSRFRLFTKQWFDKIPAWPFNANNWKRTF
jgi:hypothetical protein